MDKHVTNQVILKAMGKTEYLIILLFVIPSI